MADITRGVRLHEGTKPDLTVERLLDFSRQRGEPERLTRLRRDALSRFDATDMPYRGLHLWKYTRPSELLPLSDELFRAGAGAGDATPLGGIVDGSATATLTAGSLRAKLGPEAEAAGLRIVPLAEADELLVRLGGLVGPEHGLFEALASAAWTTGALLYVPPGAVISAPVQIQSIADGRAAVSRLLVVADEGAQVDLVEDHQGGDGGKVVSISELFVGAHARVRHVVIQRWADDARGHQTFRSRLDSGAELQTVVASLGGNIVKVDVGAELAGRDSRSDLAGVSIGSGSQHLDYHTVHHHSAPNTHSNIDFKVAVSDRAESAYTGRIEIEKQARGSRAYQENRNLLLSPDSRAETIPELEILTDDVECSHGATLSPVDPDQLFYLQSRGLSPEGALALYLQGFVTQPLAGLPEGLRDDVSRVVREVVARVAASAPTVLPAREREL